jgi:ubiquinol-cytochrome c reductase cytochrome c1 subunit
MVSASIGRFVRAAACIVWLVPFAASASEGVRLQTAPINTHDAASLQNGAKLFINYCLNCHTASYMRFNRLQDLGLTEPQIKDNLIFTGVKVGELMQVAMDRKDAKEWFGVAPPDLTVAARARSSAAGTGSDWLYSYLRSFYRDPARPTGWNNLVFPNVGMPHVLWQLSGQAQLHEEVFTNEHAAKAALLATKGVAQLEESQQARDGKTTTQYVLKTLTQGNGTLSQLDYDKAVIDIVNYMTYMAEPARFERRQIGIYVLLVLGLLFLLVFALKQSYWKTLH